MAIKRIQSRASGTPSWHLGRGRAWQGWRGEVPEFRLPVPSHGRTLSPLTQTGRDGIRLISAGGAEKGVSQLWSQDAAHRQAEGGDVGPGPGVKLLHRAQNPGHRAGRLLSTSSWPRAGPHQRGSSRTRQEGSGERAEPPACSRPWVRRQPKDQVSREPSVACFPQGPPFGGSVTHGPSTAPGWTRSGQPAPHSQPCHLRDSERAGGAEGQL